MLRGLLAATVIGGAGAIAMAIYLMQLLQPVDPSNESTVSFVIPRGRATSLVAADLTERNLLKSPLALKIAIWQNNLAGQIQAGSFTLSPSMTPAEIAETLTQGSDDQWVTIKEGLRAAEIGAYLEQELPNFSTNNPSFTTECLAYEGFLFPETYLVPSEYTTAQMCQLMREQYGEVFTLDLRNQVAANTGLSDEEAVILASIVEREARDPEQMRHVAGILLNRLEIGMALQVDATLQYAKGYNPQAKTWWAPPLAADKQIDSPYNTYQNPGLPPGPISNPGRNALAAVANPLESDELYYLHAPDGKMYYAETYEGHQENIWNYLY
ncbi:endolytic transglycosylase MltG [Candidatus Woesebacteria bacterium]|nr:endolytic transglycosylase MltG [Candidatus Woesebacteria bacterium]